MVHLRYFGKQRRWFSSKLALMAICLSIGLASVALGSDRLFDPLIEKHPDGYIAYPLGIKGIVVGEGDTYEEALADVKSAIKFHIETFGQEALEIEPPVLEAFVAEAGVAL